MFQEGRESQEHPGLRPAHVGDPVFVEGLNLVVEVPFPIPHVFHGPGAHDMGQVEVDLVEIPEGQERDDALGHAVDVDGKRAVVEVLRGSIFPEEVIAEEFEALANPVVEFRCAGIPRDGPEGAEVVARVEVVGPALRGGLAVVPGAAVVLFGRRVADHLHRGLEGLLVAGVPVELAQKGGTQEVRVVDLRAHALQGVAEGGRAVCIRPVELLQDVLAGAVGHVQEPRFAGFLVGIQQGIGHKGRADQVGLPAGNDDGPRLPGKAIAPAPVGCAFRPEGLQAPDHFPSDVFRARDAEHRKLEACRKEQCEGLGVLLFMDQQERPEVEGKPLEALGKDQPAYFAVPARCGVEEAAVQGVVGIMAGPGFLSAIGQKGEYRLSYIIILH